jgi:hypothetical protein
MGLKEKPRRRLLDIVQEDLIGGDLAAAETLGAVD